MARSTDEILRELRGLLAEDESIHSGDKVDADAVHHAIQKFADELHEALKREKSQSRHHREMEELILRHEKEVAELKKQTGNAAAMREALEYVLQFDATDEAAEQDGLTDAERIAEYADHIIECQKKARAALSEPPRNCDREKTPRELLDDYISEKGFSSPNQIGAIHEIALPVIEWIVMTAERAGLPNCGEHAPVPVPPEVQS